MTFLWSWLRWTFGFVTLEIRGAYGEKFLSICMKEEVEFWEVRRVCSGIIRIKVFLFSVKSLDLLARKSGVTLEIIDRQGLPIFLKRYRLRTGVFLGIALYFCLMLLLPRFVWSVEIPSANPVQEKEIRAVLLDEGFGVGSFIPSVDFKNLRYQLMLKQEDISFVSVNMEGCRAVVEVRFSDIKPESVDDGSPCNVVASRDGQILSVLVQSGMRCVQKGQTVQKGDLLIGGIMDTSLGYYVVHAKGKILARVTDVEVETVSLTQRVTERTGRYIVKRVWSFFGHRVDGSPWFSCPYDEFETVTETKYLSFGERSEIPVSLTEIYYYETAAQTVTLSYDEAKTAAISRLEEKDRLRYYGVETESVEDTFTESADGVTVTRVRSFVLDICEDKAFYFED